MKKSTIEIWVDLPEYEENCLRLIVFILIGLAAGLLTMAADAIGMSLDVRCFLIFLFVSIIGIPFLASKNK